MKKIFIGVGLFLTITYSIQSQTDTRKTGNYRECLTWVDQGQIGIAPAQILNGHTVTLTQNHNAYQTLTLQDNNSVLELNSNTLFLNTVPGALNMETCPDDWNNMGGSSAAPNRCVSLWGTNNLNYTPGGGKKANSSFIDLVTITRGGNYRMNSADVTVTLPGTCANTDFRISAWIRKNGNAVSSSVVVYDYTMGVFGANLPNCINGNPGTPASFNLEQIARNFSNVELGYCAPGDIIGVGFYVEKDSGCTDAIGNMRGLASFAMQRY